MFQVQILGTSAAIPTNSRFTTSQVVTIFDRHHLVDCGEGTQVQLLRHKVRLSRLDAIFISHLHGDHILGLPGLLNTLGLYERTAPLLIFGPRALQDILKFIFAQTHSYLTYELDFRPTEDFEVGEVLYQTRTYQVRALPLDHRIFCRGFLFEEINKRRKFDFYKAKSMEIPNSYFPLLKQGNSVRLEDGREIHPEQVLKAQEPPLAYAYCSDTAYNEELLEYITGVQLLYHEATFLHEMQERAHATKHSTVIEAAQMALKAKVSQLLLGHFSARYKDLSPLLAEAKTVFPNSSLAKEGQVYKLKDYLPQLT